MSKWIPPSTAVADRKYLKIYFRQAAEARVYKREEYDLLTYFGDLGGLLDFVAMIGWALSTIFVTRLFAAALIKQAYGVQKYLLDTTPYYDTQNNSGNLTPESDSDSDKKDENLNQQNLSGQEADSFEDNNSLENKSGGGETKRKIAGGTNELFGALRVVKKTKSSGENTSKRRGSFDH